MFQYPHVHVINAYYTEEKGTTSKAIAETLGLSYSRRLDYIYTCFEPFVSSENINEKCFLN